MTTKQEFEQFETAIRQPKPALEVFTSDALMLIHLLYGDKCLRANKPSRIANRIPDSVSRSEQNDL